MDNQQSGQYVPPNLYTNSNTTSTPLIQDSVPALPRNQITANQTDIDNLRAALRSTSNFVNCPYCRNQAMTRTERNCSVGNIICAVLTIGIIWLPFQCFRSKDINCYDADHFCTKCGNVLANYRAC